MPHCFHRQATLFYYDFNHIPAWWGLWRPWRSCLGIFGAYFWRFTDLLRCLLAHKWHFHRTAKLVCSGSPPPPFMPLPHIRIGTPTTYMGRYPPPPHQHKYVMFCWVPSHVGIQGNERMDVLAKLALNEAHTNIKIPYTDLVYYA